MALPEEAQNQLEICLCNRIMKKPLATLKAWEIGEGKR